MKPTKRQQNILLELDRTKTLFGIPAAFCNWYLDHPQYKNAAFDFLFDQMLIVSANTDILKQYPVKAKEQFNSTERALEDRFVPAGANLTQEQVRRSRTIGVFIGLMILGIVIWIYIHGGI